MKYAIAVGFTMSVLAVASMDAAAVTGLASVSDDAKQRVYELTRDGVDVRELATRRRIARISLPDWVWVGRHYSCPPALALAPNGDVVVTSNVVPQFWRIDGSSLAATVHEPVLEGAEGRELGFVELRWSQAIREYVAVSAAGGAWRIDPALTRGRGAAAGMTALRDRSCGVRRAGS